MSDTPRDGGAGGRTPPASVDEALAEAVRHARSASAETLLAMRALVDAACIAIHGEAAALPKSRAADSSGLRLAFAGLANGLDELAGRVGAGEVRPPDELVASLLEALDHEILRWEARSRDDSEARAVLRAFLGLRELLWEFGMRQEAAGARKGSSGPDARGSAGDASNAPGDAPARAAASPTTRSRGRRRGPPRVQRIRVQG